MVLQGKVSELFARNEMGEQAGQAFPDFLERVNASSTGDTLPRKINVLPECDTPANTSKRAPPLGRNRLLCVCPLALYAVLP